MMTEAAVTTTVRLSRRFTVAMTIGRGGFVCEWAPRLPMPGELTRQERRKYTEARDRLTGKLANELGGPVMMVDAA